MFIWSRNRSELQKLQDTYCKLMKSSYKISLRDKNKSDELHRRANQILNQIEILKTTQE
ncbi:Lacal_2735 family protein [Aquimarina pacifica]|uniref:Lacal_2735 family protein n=1 Tax=Aquimarina pacifica TaxID=1296415 RepID=UPI0004B6C726